MLEKITPKGHMLNMINEEIYLRLELSVLFNSFYSNNIILQHTGHSNQTGQCVCNLEKHESIIRWLYRCLRFQIIHVKDLEIKCWQGSRIFIKLEYLIIEKRF